MQIAVRDEPGKPAPLREFQFGFNALDAGEREGDREADAGVQQQVVISEIAGVAAIDCAVQPQVVKQALGETGLVEIAAGRTEGKRQTLPTEAGVVSERGQ